MRPSHFPQCSLSRWRFAVVAAALLAASSLPAATTTAQPEITAIVATADGIQISWNAPRSGDTTLFWAAALAGSQSPSQTDPWIPCAGPFPPSAGEISWTDTGGPERPPPLSPAVGHRFYRVVADSSALTVWPNPISFANSDTWLVEHHGQIQLMQPRVLVLNFSNNTAPRQASALANALVAAVRESSRWHGYADPAAPAFLEYQIVKIVDLRDVPPVPSCDGNSTKFPRVPNWSGGNNFIYSELYGPTFAEYYGYARPDQPTGYLTLAELAAQGIIHELWFFANHGDCGAPYETIELKQYYDAAFRKRPGGMHSGYGPAGNGHDFGMPWIGRSFRITFINPHRGIGCAMENFGHALEGMRNYNAIPYYTDYFSEFAGFDLQQRYGLPFDSFYWLGGSDSNEYPAPTTLISHYRGTDYTVQDYVALGGNVHFTPNGRGHYDLGNPAPVMSTIRSWRLGNGPGGEDLAELFTIADFQQYNSLAPDCMGPWLVYWRQNMPGLNNLARDDSGQPMKNWWPFLFY